MQNTIKKITSINPRIIAIIILSAIVLFFPETEVFQKKLNSEGSISTSNKSSSEVRFFYDTTLKKVEEITVNYSIHKEYPRGEFNSYIITDEGKELHNYRLNKEFSQIIREGEKQTVFKAMIELDKISALSLWVPYFKSINFDHQYRFNVSHIGNTRIVADKLDFLSIHGTVLVKGKYTIIGFISTRQAREEIEEWVMYNSLEEINKQIMESLEDSDCF